jgi:DNA-binding transcriptional ArsR family regulator
LDPAARLEALEAVMSALAHPARRQILLTIHFRGGSVSAGDIAARFDHAWPTTTRHLRVLERAGLIHHGRQGRSRVYRLDLDRLGLVKEWLAWFEPAPPELPGRKRR